MNSALFLLYFIIYKTIFNMGNGVRLTEEEVLSRINERCIEANVEFIGFDNEENKYKNDVTRLTLKCNKCGNIWKTTTYGKFVRGKRGCPNCSKTKEKTEKDIIDDINRLCEEKDYTFLGFNGEFVGIYTKLKLKCNKCNREWHTTSYNNFRKIGRNSHSCKKNNPSKMTVRYDTDEIIEKIKSKLIGTSLEFVSFDERGYVGRTSTHVLLKCKVCGEVNNFSYSYVIGNNIKCKYCEFGGKFSHEKAVEIVEEKCKKLNYTFLGFLTDNGRYNGERTYLILQCNKCGYLWKSTTFGNFRKTIKCMHCINSWKMEKEIESLLRSKDIEFVEHCRTYHLPWLKNKISLSLDFYLPQYNIGIECQGRQHFEVVSTFGGEKGYEESLERDTKKLNLCKENGLKLLYYDSENNHKEFLGEKVYNTENEILKVITSYGQKNKNISNP